MRRNYKTEWMRLKRKRERQRDWREARVSSANLRRCREKVSR